jgi:indole-3-glycerol phosphate synthase
MGILETICEERRADALRLKRELPPSSLERLSGPIRPSFALHRGPRAAPLLIAECKKASPSRGLMVPDYDAAALAKAYERGGSGMLSVLTEPRRFLGSGADLEAARACVGLPVLRKDFIVDGYQVLEAWAMGADAILLIAAALEGSELLELAAQARELGLAVLVEVHEESELEAALACGPDAIGVNARDLRDFRVDLGRARDMAGLLPDAMLRVAESGIRAPSDAAELLRAGYRGFLVGEALATSAEPEARAREFAAALSVASAAALAAASEGKKR